MSAFRPEIKWSCSDSDTLGFVDNVRMLNILT